MNQYRCETCKNRKTIYGEYACEVVSRKMTKCFYEWVTKVGCASHSDFQSERDKMLDELEKRITEEELVFLFTILGYIKELRQAGE